jgi:hypothetical protein
MLASDCSLLDTLWCMVCVPYFLLARDLERTIKVDREVDTLTLVDISSEATLHDLGHYVVLGAFDMAYATPVGFQEAGVRWRLEFVDGFLQLLGSEWDFGHGE